MIIEPEEPSEQGPQHDPVVDPRDTTTTSPERSPSVIRRHGNREVEERVVDLSHFDYRDDDERASPDADPSRTYIEDDPASTRRYVEVMKAYTDHLKAQTDAHRERNRGRQVVGNTVVQVLACLVAAASVVAWLIVVLSHGSATDIAAVSAVALVATNFATVVITKGRSGKDDGSE